MLDKKRPGEERAEVHQQAASENEAMTSNFGCPISDDQNSLRAGAHGPGLLEDFLLREKIHHFDHERIPERIVHARGSGAHGHFELTKSLAKYTRAKVLTEVGQKTEVFVRFSTVAGGAGSVDTPRDVRGFAVKFYTKEGNWDLVGNNIPVFFIQDAIKFPDLIHSVKMEANSGYPQSATAHDTFWDFMSLMPEAMHMVMWIMSDRTIPRSLRMMEGFGVNTFRLLDANDKPTFVKFHWRPKLGLQSTAWDEAVKIAGADPDYHRRDLYAAIEAGDFPEWEFGVQLLTQEQADALPSDLLDATKLIPEEVAPVEIVGRMVLDRNPDNFFAETEQAAYLPTNIVPGIDFSDDPLLQGRLFSYQDTQLSRLGSHNFHQLPINRAKGCPVMNFRRDGHMQFELFKGRANYEPNSLGEAGEEAGPREIASGFRTTPQAVEGEKARLRAESFADHYSQARLFYRSQSEPEQAHIVNALTFELSKVNLEPVRLRMISHLLTIDESLGKRVADGLGVEKLPDAAKPAEAVQDLDLAKSLRIIDKYPRTLKGRAIAILVSDGADEKIVEAVASAGRKAGADVKIIAQKVEGVKLAGGKKMKADGQLAGSPSVLFDAVALVVSKEAAQKLARDAAAVDFVANAFAHLKAIGFTPEAQTLLDLAHVEADEHIVELKDHADAFLKAATTRAWAREKKVHPEL